MRQSVKKQLYYTVRNRVVQSCEALLCSWMQCAMSLKILAFFTRGGWRQGREAHCPPTQQSHEKWDDCEVLQVLWQSSVGQSITWGGVEAPDTVGIKTLIGERRNPLEGMWRKMDGSQIWNRFFTMTWQGSWVFLGHGECWLAVMLHSYRLLRNPERKKHELLGIWRNVTLPILRKDL